MVVVNQQIVTPVVVVVPVAQALALMQASESHQIFLEVLLFMEPEVQGAGTLFSALPKQPALEQSHDLMQ
jgi:hypothetical protein